MKEKLIVILIGIYIFSFSILSLVLPKEEYSTIERRKLKSMPEYSLDGEYINDLDGYLLDHFPGRNGFRSIKANFKYNILNSTDNNKIIIKDDYIFKMNYPTNLKSVENFKKIINKIISDFSDDNNVYMVVVPDKNYYLKDEGMLKIDYKYIDEYLSDLNLSMIDIKDLLVINDYYKTDTHWRQEKISKVVKHLSEYMNLPYKNQEYKENKYSKFYGVYYGEAAINKKPDTLIYLNNEYLDSLSVYYLENKNLNSIYNLEKLDSKDSYEVFLDGASAYIEITNKNSLTDKELVIFRDSFGSSITPLLTPYYKKITLIDNRYINSANYLNMIDFTNQDILFVYSTLLVNESYALKG